MSSDRLPELSKDEERSVRAAMGMPEEKPRGKTHADNALEARSQAHAAVKAANRAANRGDLAEAKQWTNVAKHLSDVVETLAKTPIPEPSWEEDEACRLELMDRIAKFAESDNGRSRWLMRKQIWEEMTAEARRTGGPPPPSMPPPPPHWSDDLPEDLRRKLGYHLE